MIEPLQLGEMGQAHVVPGEYWKQLFERLEATVTGALTVGQLRRWMDEPRPRGLPLELQDLIVLVFAQQTNRGLLHHGGPAPSEIGKLKDDMVLVAQRLPGETEWKRVLEMALKVFGLPNLPQLRTVSSLSRVTAELKQAVQGFKGSANKLVIELDKAASEFGISTVGNVRLQAAREGLSILDLIDGRNGAELVEAVAALALTVPDAALATSIKKSDGVVLALSNRNSALWRKLSGNKEPAARALWERFVEAFSKHEYAIALGPLLKQIETEAVEVLTRPSAATETPQPAPGVEQSKPPVPLPPTVAERQRRLKDRYGKSQLPGDNVPDWIPAERMRQLLTVVEVSTADGGMAELVVTPNMKAFLETGARVTFDLATKKLSVEGLAAPVAVEIDNGNLPTVP